MVVMHSYSRRYLVNCVERGEQVSWGISSNVKRHQHKQSTRNGLALCSSKMISRGVQVVNRSENSAGAIALEEDKDIFILHHLNLLACDPTTDTFCSSCMPFFLIPNISPSQVDLLLSDPVTSGLIRLWTPSVETAILSANVESITCEDDKEDEVTGENHAKSCVEVRRVIPYIGRPDVGRGANGVDERKPSSSLWVGSSDMER
jgi:hypothetical protein